ncbi:NADP-dependent oxidoreductase [Actinomadura sp. NAK00032]|uniref:NADP-dependent oxidoreductase n=1 Tax=Actinomadura sp. NAK00032 TaxID=2742128 RepID=UPI0015903724|nr:NADP-dependent oxidoreductase [Actinomadura sp. NAK00032]QKW33681.1 NADP-dependent oxidoreductase [Actinomadura sp. NAK00032]
MPVKTFRQMVLRERPSAGITADTFAEQTMPVPSLQDGEALVEVVWLGIDATQRTWLNPDATYTAPVGIGDVMRGSGVGRVVASRNAALPEGQWVYGDLGWREYVVARDGGLFGVNPVPDGIDPRHMLTVFGVSGLTAFFGMSRVLNIADGDTVLVTGAAGSVGSLAGQIARLLGARVIGTAGSPEKVAWVKDVAGFDACVDYRADDVPAALQAFAPDGLTAVFDNVGGVLLENALDRLAIHARIALCGSISSGYTATGYGTGPSNYMQLAFRRARMEGFIFFDYLSEFPEALSRLAGWLAAGELHWAEDVIDGLHNAPTALQRLFDGANLGKQLVRVS